MASFYYNEKHTMQIIPDDISIFKFKRKNGVVTSVKMNGINTWKDWKLIPSSRPLFNAPKVKTNYIDLPGANGSIDATQVLSNYIYYQNREGSNEFYVANRDLDWATVYSMVMNYLQGKRVKIILSDDPGFYYRGRLAVNQWKSEQDFSRIVIDYVLEPYKYEIISTNEDWLWDPFNFYTGIIRKKSDYTNVRMNAYDATNLKFEMNFYPRQMPVVPIITIKPTFYLNGGSSTTVSGGTGNKEDDVETLRYYKLAYEVIEGLWGNGDTRVTKLTEAGYDYQTVQNIVNVCYEVDDGEWGEGSELVAALEAAGYDYDCVMAVINAYYSGEYVSPGGVDPTPDPGPATPREITVMTANAKGRKVVKRTLTLPSVGASKTYRYPDLVISEENPKLIFTLEYGMNLLVTVYYRGGML